MVGFELFIRGQKYQAALENGTVSILITSGKSTKNGDFTRLDFIGTNLENDNFKERIDWYNTTLELEDEIVIKVKDIFKNSESVNVRRQEKKSKDEVDLENYKRLKRRLEEKGLI